ncbi:MAG TPA: hypothetical protein VMR74_09875 [Gammaproteobacteria bacterium]|nr:hypothetical protein [Gammaproteobacteria bacterium]
MLSLAASASAFAQTTVTLLEPGAQPRHELRYSFEEGYAQQGTMEMVIQLGSERDGKSSAISNPAVSLLSKRRRTSLSHSTGTRRA